MGSILDVITAPVSSIIDTVAGIANMPGQAHYQRKNMREAARLQHEENVFWAEYNTPANQMARLKDAGLNPNLVYGNGADAQYSGSVSPSGGMPSADIHPGRDYVNFTTMLKQLQNVDADTNLKNEEARGKKIQNDYNENLLTIDRAHTENRIKYAEWEKTQNESDLAASRAALAHAETISYEIRNNVESQYAEEIRKQLLDYGYLQMENMRIQNAHLDEILQNQADLTAAQARQAAAMVTQLNALAHYYDELAQKVDIEEGLLKAEIDVKEQEKRNLAIQNYNDRIRSVGLILDNGLKALEKEFRGRTKVADVMSAYLRPANVAANAIGIAVPGVGAGMMNTIK